MKGVSNTGTPIPLPFSIIYYVHHGFHFILSEKSIMIEENEKCIFSKIFVE